MSDREPEERIVIGWDDLPPDSNSPAAPPQAAPPAPPAPPAQVPGPEPTSQFAAPPAPAPPSQVPGPEPTTQFAAPPPPPGPEPTTQFAAPPPPPGSQIPAGAPTTQFATPPPTTQFATPPPAAAGPIPGGPFAPPAATPPPAPAGPIPGGPFAPPAATPPPAPAGPIPGGPFAPPAAGPPPGPAGYAGPPPGSAGYAGAGPYGGPAGQSHAGLPRSASSFLPRLSADSIVAATVACAAGGIIGYLLNENLQNPGVVTANTTAGADFRDGLWLAIFGAVVGAFLMAWEGITSASPQKAVKDAGIGLGIGAVAGMIGGVAWGLLWPRFLPSTSGFLDGSGAWQGPLIGARMLSFGLFGLLLGLGFSVFGGPSKMLSGLTGGFAGGVVAGLVYQVLWDAFATSTLSDGFGANLSQSHFWAALLQFGQGNVDPRFVLRFFGLLISAALIGAGIGSAERLFRQNWLRIESGPMAGRQFILYKDSTSAGHDFNCDLVLGTDPAAAPKHAIFTRDFGGDVTVVPEPGAVVSVNGTPSPGARLKDRDTLTLGSSTLVYHKRSLAPKPPAPQPYGGGQPPYGGPPQPQAPYGGAPQPQPPYGAPPQPQPPFGGPGQPPPPYGPPPQPGQW